jgi:hypothetical protein
LLRSNWLIVTFYAPINSTAHGPAPSEISNFYPASIAIMPSMRMATAEPICGRVLRMPLSLLLPFCAPEAG